MTDTVINGAVHFGSVNLFGHEEFPAKTIFKSVLLDQFAVKKYPSANFTVFSGSVDESTNVPMLSHTSDKLTVISINDPVFQAIVNDAGAVLPANAPIYAPLINQDDADGP